MRQSEQKKPHNPTLQPYPYNPTPTWIILRIIQQTILEFSFEFKNNPTIPLETERAKKMNSQNLMIEDKKEVMVVEKVEKVIEEEEEVADILVGMKSIVPKKVNKKRDSATFTKEIVNDPYAQAKRERKNRMNAGVHRGGEGSAVYLGDKEDDFSGGGGATFTTILKRKDDPRWFDAREYLIAWKKVNPAPTHPGRKKARVAGRGYDSATNLPESWKVAASVIC